MDKILVTVHVLSLEEKYDFFLPINLPMSNVIKNIQISISEITNGLYQGSEKVLIFDSLEGKIINQNNIVKFSGLKNGSDILIVNEFND